MSDPAAQARAHCDKLQAWLTGAAYPLWWRLGADRERGGFAETIGQDGQPTDDPRRARLQPRQIYAFAMAPELGWDGPAGEAVAHALSFFLKHYRRDDGFFRTLAAADGAPLDDRVVLYDQAFAMLGLAHAWKTLGRGKLKATAEGLRDRLRERLAHPLGGFEEEAPRALPLRSNPHMHLLEAALTWRDMDGGEGWSLLADEIAQLALTRFIDPASGALLEHFDGDWAPAGDLIEPGHQFEWAWLLLRWGGEGGREAALRLIAVGEDLGVDPARGVAVNALGDPTARLWPQTERIKAGVAAALATGEACYWEMAAQGAEALGRYLETPVAGLWRDRMLADGSFVDEPAPASSFYHIVGAAAELRHALAGPEAALR